MYILSPRLQKSGSLWPWCWITSCCACSWLCVSLARWVCSQAVSLSWVCSESLQFMFYWFSLSWLFCDWLWNSSVLLLRGMHRTYMANIFIYGCFCVQVCSWNKTLQSDAVFLDMYTGNNRRIKVCFKVWLQINHPSIIIFYLHLFMYKFSDFSEKKRLSWVEKTLLKKYTLKYKALLRQQKRKLNSLLT